MKIKKNITGTQFLALITLFMLSCNNDDDGYSNQPEPKSIQLKVIGKGAAVAQFKTFTHPKTGEAIEADCYLMGLIDLDTGHIIGTLEDCVVDMEVPSDGTITSRVITSININGRGTIQAESTVFQEMYDPINLDFNTSFTPTNNNVINTSLEFEGMEGTVSLEGEINYSDFGHGILVFNNNFSINLANN